MELTQSNQSDHPDATFELDALGKKILTTATTRQIVETFIGNTQDVEKIHYLILAHPQFIEEIEFLKEFLQCFKSTDDQPKQFRIVNILKKWMELSSGNLKDPNSKIGKEIRNFLEYLGDSQLASFVRSALEPQKEEEKEESSVQPPPIIYLKRLASRKKRNESSLLLYDCEEIARQLTLIDHQNLASIDIGEMLKTRWTSPQAAPTLQKCSLRANELAFWFALQLAEANKLKTRIKLLDHIIKISMYLSKMHNYQSLMTLFLALNMRSTGKLTQTWKGLKPKTYAMWKRISTLMSPKDNFGHYRASVSSLDVPFIPCQEVVLKDLLYHDESTPDFLEDGRWNMKKLYVIGNILSQFRRCQEQPYNIALCPELRQFLIEIRNDITATELDEKCSEIENPTGKMIPIDKISAKNKISTTNSTRSEKTEATESETTDDAESSLSGSVVARNSRTRSGSVGSDYTLTRRRSFEQPGRRGSEMGTKIAVTDGKMTVGRRAMKMLATATTSEEEVGPQSLTERMRLTGNEELEEGCRTPDQEKRKRKKDGKKE